MKINSIILSVGIVATAFCACKKQADIKIQFPERFEGKAVELMDYKDSTLLATTVIKNGEASFVTSESDSVKLPSFMQIAVDGRIYAYYVAEPGHAFVSDSTNVATGTPLNDKLNDLLARLDSIENLDDMNKYVEFTEQQYNANKDNPLGDYFGIEWLKYADAEKVDSMLKTASPQFRDARRVKHYTAFARHRLATAPGKKYIDFNGENASGASIKLSSLVSPQKYTLLDFWASWCPYCIKELPELKKLSADFAPLLNIVGVAVRDLPDDTKAMVKKQEIAWPILYNTQKIPYDIYGFSGIPHHILIDPDGIIVSRGESVEQIRNRLEKILADSNVKIKN